LFPSKPAPQYIDDAPEALASKPVTLRSGFGGRRVQGERSKRLAVNLQPGEAISGELFQASSGSQPTGSPHTPVAAKRAARRAPRFATTGG